MSGSYSSGCENNKTSVIYRLGYRYAGSFKNSMRGLLSIGWARTAACDGYQVMYADNKNFQGKMLQEGEWSNILLCMG